jgi:hypothetical protein
MVQCCVATSCYVGVGGGHGMSWLESGGRGIPVGGGGYTYTTEGLDILYT